MSRLRRFLHIERARTKPPGAAPPSGADLDRFGPEPPPTIELLETASGERPFTRCMRCGMDHGVFATAPQGAPSEERGFAAGAGLECTGCGASLDTEAQRDFNERLWARRQDEAAREAAASEVLRAARAEADAEVVRARRALGETLAREVGERERRRLDAELGGGGRPGSLRAGDLLRRIWRTLTRRVRRFGDAP
jgi:hypothetical protein